MPKPKINLFKHPVLLAFPAIIAAIEFIRMSLFITFLPSFLTKLHFDTAAIGLIISANILADNLMKSPAGLLVDHHGPWPVLLSGSTLCFIGLILIANFHTNLLVLVLVSVIIGVGVAPTWPGSISGALSIAGEAKRATLISIISVVWLIGGGSGTILMGFLIDSNHAGQWHLPLQDVYRAGFLLLLIISVVAIIICILGWLGWLRVPHLQKIEEKREINKPKFKEALLRLWEIKGLVPGMFLQTLALGMLLPNLLPYTMSRFGFTETQYSLLLLTGGLVVILFMVPVGHLTDKFGSKRFLVAGFLIAAAAIAWVVTYGNIFNIWWVVGFIGLAYALIQPAWNALMAASIPPGQRGILMGLFMSVEGLGFGVGPVVGGVLGTLTVEHHLFGKIQAALPFYISSILLFFMAIVYLVYPFHQYQFEE